jgi:hypothetical protein
MPRTSQLTRLLWDFYREDPEELRQLKILQQCSVFRFWGRLYVRCQTHATAERLQKVVALIEVPVAQLRLAKRIKILVGRQPVALFDVSLDRFNPEMQERLL